MIKSDLTKMNINIYQPYLNTEMAQGFINDVKLLMTLNTLATPHRRFFVINKQVQKYWKINRRDTGFS